MGSWRCWDVVGLVVGPLTAPTCCECAPPASPSPKEQLPLPPKPRGLLNNRQQIPA